MSMRGFCIGVATMAIAANVTVPAGPSRAQPADAAIRVGDGDLAGVVSGPSGPEAGVWVIAQTTELATKFAKIVVTDDRGRYLIPDLPKANYSVWVRGYGLVDSAKLQSVPGKLVDLTAEARPRSSRCRCAPTRWRIEGPSATIPLPQRRWRLARDHRQKTPETFSRT